MTSPIWNLHEPPRPEALDDGSIEFDVDEQAPEGHEIDPETGARIIRLADGSVEIDLGGKDEAKVDKDSHWANLADKVDESELDHIASDLIEGIEADDKSRQEWLETRRAGFELLGLKLENPSSDAGGVEGMSRVRHPLLLEAVLQAQATARAELLPASGPVKVTNDGEETGGTDKLAEALEKQTNRFLTRCAKEFYPDTDRMLFMTVFGGSGFKKVYRHPFKRRPTSESVDAADLIVDASATDLESAQRVTHRSEASPNTIRRMQVAGHYRQVDLTSPTRSTETTAKKIEGDIEGRETEAVRPEDQPHTLYECYCELDLDDFAPAPFKGKQIALPYRVTIEKDSRKILAIIRDWAPEDTECLRDTTFVHYCYIRGVGFYGIGLLHILGNSTRTLTGAWREALDAGMFASFPGFLIAKEATRGLTDNTIRVGPGQGKEIATNGMKISDAVMALPYKDVTPGLMSLIDKVQDATRRVAGSAEIQVGEGRQDAPVGTTIALIEQATKIESAVHKNLHHAQSEELQLLAKLFREDPESLWRGDRRKVQRLTKELVIEALDTYGLDPQSDPNTPSHIHRIMKAMALKQVAATNPQMDKTAVDKRILSIIGIDDVDSLFLPPQPPGPAPIDPVKAQAAAKLSELQARAAMKQADLADKDKERELKRELAGVDLAKTLAIHPGSQGVVDSTMAEFVPHQPN